jgi:hypothetical protein
MQVKGRSNDAVRREQQYANVDWTAPSVLKVSMPLLLDVHEVSNGASVRQWWRLEEM